MRALLLLLIFSLFSSCSNMLSFDKNMRATASIEGDAFRKIINNDIISLWAEAENILVASDIDDLKLESFLNRLKNHEPGLVSELEFLTMEKLKSDKLQVLEELRSLTLTSLELRPSLSELENEIISVLYKLQEEEIHDQELQKVLVKVDELKVNSNKKENVGIRKPKKRGCMGSLLQLFGM